MQVPSSVGSRLLQMLNVLMAMCFEIFVCFTSALNGAVFPHLTSSAPSVHMTSLSETHA